MQAEKPSKTLNKQIKPLEENIQFRANPPPSKAQVYFLLSPLLRNSSRLQL